MAESSLKEVEDSYARARISPKFFDDFYDIFLASSAEVKAKFKKTDLAKQKELLREGIIFLIMFARGNAIGKSKIERLTATHRRQGHDIGPHLYPLWTTSLIKALAKHDAKFTPTLEKEWRAVLQKGIDEMKAGY